LARGHALQRGRKHITLEDVPIVVKTVISTAHIDRVAVFSLLTSLPEGKLTTDQIIKFLNKSRHYALKTMTEFKAIGLVDMDDVNVNVEVKKQPDRNTLYQRLPSE
jgi:predicted transcriptional regulator